MTRPPDARPTYAVTGELQRLGDVVTGWCWSADRPSERLIVGLRVNGDPAGAVVAARLRLDLVRDGVCDGYHAFTIALPSSVPGYFVIEAFERGTGQVFGRLRSGEMPELGLWSDRSAALSQAVATLHAGLPGRARPAPLRQVLREAGRGLSRHVKAGPALPRLPHVGSPAFSLVLHGSGAAAELRAAICRLAPLLQHHRAELVAIGGREIVELEGLKRVDDAGTAAETMQAAALAALGERLVFLQAAWTSSAGVARLLGSEPGITLLGPTAVQAARTAELCWKLPQLPGGTRIGLELLVDRRTFHHLGGFDPSMDDGAGLHLVDLSLRLLQGGYGLAAFPDAAREVKLSPTRPLARVRFAARWANFGHRGGYFVDSDRTLARHDR